MSGGTLKAPAFTLAEGATHVVMLNSQRRFGFTLAEVLVTLGIIGVVSAMTVPSLIQNYQRQSYVTQLHKFYNELSQALVRYQNDRNAVNLTEAGLSSNAALKTFMNNYFKVVQSCDTASSPCFAASYRRLDGVGMGELNSAESYVIASGAAIRPLYSKDNQKIVNFLVDINGQKGPNIWGRDIFVIGAYNNGLLDSWAEDVVSAPLTKEEREAAPDTWKAFADILNDNWEMTY